jgi:hypothetical protein
MNISLVRADFNGLFEDLLCLSHSESTQNESGAEVLLQAGLLVTAYDEDPDEHGRMGYLLATGIVEPSPPELRCMGSRWVLRIDANGVRHESVLPGARS